MKEIIGYINKKTKRKIAIFIIMIIVIVGILLFKRNYEHFASYRIYKVERIEIVCLYDGTQYKNSGFGTVYITDETEVKEFRNKLYDLDTDANWFVDNVGAGPDFQFNIKVWYEDDYCEEIGFSGKQDMKTGGGRKLLSKKYWSFSAADSYEIYDYCYDLFFDINGNYIN